ncbi:hypothetical protein Y1Q_0013897 [Alligator mississippiensis]|uniref:Ig-like domain-containing protein n=1 Tax=Alligator mississippiensis TaxID=8496 RepID=A0A151MPC1_ALLMI|nr:hypothetical protein Y1Q_0013897 [Alligator mississippiensis]
MGTEGSGAAQGVWVRTAPSYQAVLGAGARLQCFFDVGEPVALSALRVTWYLWDERIARYAEGKGHAYPGASLEETALESGNATLVLARVTLADEGLYKSDAGSIFSCRVQHLALEQPLREEFPLEVAVQEAGTDRTGTIIGVSLGIAVAVAAAAMAIYCWSKQRDGRGSSAQGGLRG